MSDLKLCYKRRSTHPVHVGAVVIGGDAPIRVQSMTNVDTNDVPAGIAQTERIVEAGGEIVRFTAQGVREAKALKAVREGLDARGCHVPLVADIHFNPKAAYEAACHVEKVRINPGNFYDPARKFKIIEYTDQEYEQEVRELSEAFADFLRHCREHHTAIRIGVNHGSLSDRIMSRYGDTPGGMVESCMEFLNVCEAEGFRDVVISIKASNALVMTATVRQLCERMAAGGMDYPLHLGVTEAGDGEDGRIKSAVGIGALLSEGIGDTIRVSLSEDPEAEIPVARLLVQCAREQALAPPIICTIPDDRAKASSDTLFPGYHVPLVVMKADPSLNTLKGDERPDLLVVEDKAAAADYPDYRCIDQSQMVMVTDEALIADPSLPHHLPADHLIVVRLCHPNVPDMMRVVGRLMAGHPYLISLSCDAPQEEVPTRLGYLLGSALLRGEGAGLLLEADTVSPIDLSRIAFGLLQASRQRITRTEYISCPGCGRTLFGLADTVAKVKAATAHLKGLKVGVMGCIVNGPGEMADADYGYVGSAPGKIDLYKSKVCVAKNIPQGQAVDSLVALIRENGDWVEPE